MDKCVLCKKIWVINVENCCDMYMLINDKKILKLISKKNF